jgi:hypothetical protein
VEVPTRSGYMDPDREVEIILAAAFAIILMVRERLQNKALTLYTKFRGIESMISHSAFGILLHHFLHHTRPD